MEPGKIFVGGLDWNTEQDGLRSHFSQYGQVSDCVVMRTEGGKSRGFGFVKFDDADTVSVVLAKKHTLDGRVIDAKPCSAKGSNSGANKSQRPNYSGKTTKIFIGGLPNDANEDNLKSFFGKFGLVTEVVIMMNEDKTRSRGFGFLTFDTEVAVEEAVKEHYMDFHGKKIEIKRAEPRQGQNRNKFQDQGWGDWNQNQSFNGAYAQQSSNQYGGHGNQGYDPNWSQNQYSGQSWGQNQGYSNGNYGQGGYNQSYTGQGYANQGYSGAQGYSGNQGYSGAQGYSGNQGYSGAQSYGSTGGGYSAQGYSGGSGGSSSTQGYGGAPGYVGAQGYSGGGSQSQDGYSGSSGGGGKSSSNGGSSNYHPYKR